MWGEKNTTIAIDGKGVGKFEHVGPNGLPNLVGGQLRGSWCEVESAHGHAGSEKFSPVFCVRNGFVVDEYFRLENESIALDARRRRSEHFDADACEGAALGELKLGEVFLPKNRLVGIARPECERQSQGLVFLRRLHGQDLAVLAGPELIRLHAKGTKLRMAVLTSDRCRLKDLFCFAPLLSSSMNTLIPNNMKIRRYLSYSAIAVSLLVSPSDLFAEEDGANPPQDQFELSDAEMLEIYGWMAGMRAGISRLGLNVAETEAFNRGIDAARSNRDLDVDLQAVGPLISKFVQAKFDTHMARLKADEDAKAEAYWAEILNEEGVDSLPSGLAYKILVSGSEIKPVASDTVRVHYTGRLIDGTVFDTSDGGGPFVSKLDEVIEGWTQGVPLIGEGGVMKLYVPAKLGYGDAGSGRIPPGATLVFDVELIEVIKSESADKAGVEE